MECSLLMVNGFDAGIVSFLNHFARKSWALDILFVLSSSYLVRVAGIVPLYWWAWFRHGEGKTEKRELLVYGMISSLVALLISRGVSHILPYRARPMQNPELHFQAPYGQSTDVLLGWSSFPSDHAAAYFAVVICLYFVSRRLGLFALGWAIFITSLPRIYLGIHYPTDIIAGAIIGIGVAYLARNPAILSVVTGRVMRWHDRHPGPFYALMFLFTLQLATAFESVLLLRDYVEALVRHAVGLPH